MIPRPNILSILIRREFLRLWKNPSALMLLGLVTALSMLLALVKPGPKPTIVCWVVFVEDGEWVGHLRKKLPPNDEIRLVPIADVTTNRAGHRIYPANTCAIEILPVQEQTNSGATPAFSDRLFIHYRFAGTKPEILGPFVQWFARSSIEHFGEIPSIVERTSPAGYVSTANLLADKLSSGSVQDLLTEELGATISLAVVLFVTCWQMLVSFTGQDQERGTLIAMSLTPARPSELLIAKYLFHGMLGIGASAAIVAILRPQFLTNIWLWLCIVITCIALMSVGTVITSLGRTQSTAGFIALCYVLAGGVVSYLATKFPELGWIKRITFEHYSFGLLFVSLSRRVPLLMQRDFHTLVILACLWTAMASVLFRRRALKV